jgi:hypothetical protein
MLEMDFPRNARNFESWLSPQKKPSQPSPRPKRKLGR